SIPRELATAPFVRRCRRFLSSLPPGAALISEASQTLTPESPSLSVRAAELVKDLRALAYDHVELVALEAQRAASSLATMLCAAVVISIRCVTAWLALVAG